MRSLLVFLVLLLPTVSVRAADLPLLPDFFKLLEIRRLTGELPKLRAAGKWEEAAVATEKILDYVRSEMSKQHDLLTGLLGSLAEIREEQEKFDLAAKARQEVLDVRKALNGPDDWRTTNARLDLEQTDRLARLTREQRQDLRRAQALHVEAVELHGLGKFVLATEKAEQILQLRQGVLGAQHLAVAYSCNNLAHLHYTQGQYGKAEPLYQKALDIKLKVYGERHPDTAAGYNNLASLYWAQGQFGKAEPLFLKALDIRVNAHGENHLDVAQSDNNLALLYHLQGQSGKAELFYQKALAVHLKTLGANHPDTSTSYNNLAALYESQGWYEKAEPLFQKSLAIRSKTFGEKHPYTASLYNNLAHLYAVQEQYGKAEPLYQKALDFRQKLLGEQHPDTAQSYNNLANLYRAQGQLGKAEPLFQKALLALSLAPADAPVEQRLAVDGLRPLPETVQYASNYATALAETAQNPAGLRQADEACARALALKDRLRSEVFADEPTKLHHGSQNSDVVPTRLGLLRKLYAAEGQAADLETAVAAVEQGTARVFLEQLGKARAAQLGRVEPKWLVQEADFKNQLAVLDKLITEEQSKPTNKRDAARVGQLFDQQKELEGRLQQLVAQMEKDYPQYAALKYPQPCSLTDARACLDPNEVALLFVPGAQESFVVVVEARPKADDPTHGVAIVPLPKEEDLSDGASRLCDRATFTQATTTRSAGETAYDLLLAPVADRIRGKDLVVVPGGTLCQIPFEALRENGQFLIERHRIRYAPSLTALHLIRRWESDRDKPTTQLWALGDPQYEAPDDRPREVALREGRRDAPFGRLKNSGAEVRAVAQLLQAARASCRTEADATEAAVKAASRDGSLAQARYVHFACHGILGFDVGQQPALVLGLVGVDNAAEADGGCNDGFLRLDEVTRLRMNADLVVLSACRTGQGRLQGGEGVTGLARAFLYAGSRGVLSSLWSVDDAETPRFMVDVYAGLQEGKTTAEAVRAAKLKMIRENQPAVFWAPFIHIGE